jgi:hypothetical protein
MGCAGEFEPRDHMINSTLRHGVLARLVVMDDLAQLSALATLSMAADGRLLAVWRRL